MKDSLPWRPIISLNIALLHSAGQAFFACESSEKIKHALKNNIHSSGEYDNINEEVYCKREKSEKWKGPDTVLKQDGPLLFPYHRIKFVKAHICGVQPVETKDQAKSVNQSIQPTDKSISLCNSSRNYKSTNRVPQNDEDSDDKPEALNSNSAERMSNDATPSLPLSISNEPTNIPKLKVHHLKMQQAIDALQKC